MLGWGGETCCWRDGRVKAMMVDGVVRPKDGCGVVVACALQCVRRRRRRRRAAAAAERAREVVSTRCIVSSENVNEEEKAKEKEK